MAKLHPLPVHYLNLHHLATALSLLTITLLLRPLLPLPHPTSTIFTPRDPRSHYRTPRNYASYPFATVCSPPAKHHFLTRLTRPTAPIPPSPNLTSPTNRVFLSSLPVNVGDGLGHRTAILNYELTLSLLLGLTYTHRHSLYGSLTADDPNAVENTFHFGAGTRARSEVLATSCAEVTHVNDTCEIPSARISCSRLRRRSAGGSFDQSVIIPLPIARCLLTADVEPPERIQQCKTLIRPFLAAYPEPNTLFQLPTSGCFQDFLYTSFEVTSGILRRRYWRHAAHPRGWAVDRVQLAVHVRRGDFFNYTQRVLIPDRSYADVVWRLKHAVDEVVQADVPVDVHVYSEGRARGRVKDMHDTRLMDAVYVDETGVARARGHWKRVLQGHRRGGRGDVRVFEHIAGDTLQGVREMVAADLFVGSVSGLSVQVVRTVGRGVLALPVWEGEVGARERSVVAFEWARNGFDSFLDEQRLYEVVAESVRRSRLACAVW